MVHTEAKRKWHCGRFIVLPAAKQMTQSCQNIYCLMTDHVSPTVSLCKSIIKQSGFCYHAQRKFLLCLKDINETVNILEVAGNPVALCNCKRPITFWIRAVYIKPSFYTCILSGMVCAKTKTLVRLHERAGWPENLLFASVTNTCFACRFEHFSMTETFHTREAKCWILL